MVASNPLTLRAAFALIGAIIAAFALPALAAEPVVPGNPAPTADALVRRPGTLGIFEAQADGSIRHVQSGFACPSGLPNVNFWNLQVIPSPLGLGTDVGCDYGRVRGGQVSNGAESKLTIYIVKAQAGMTLDDAFRRYQMEMFGANPGARSSGEVIHLQGSSDGLPGVRSEGAAIAIGNRPYMTELVVSLVNGWIIEIRSTYPTAFTPGDPATGIDIPASAVAWTTAVGAYAKAADTK
jgi:hypothetical protein